MSEVAKPKIALLTDSGSWLLPKTKEFNHILAQKGYPASVFERHEDIDDSYQIVFILSYFKIIPDAFLARHEYNLVVHESALPHGRGWSPMFWQILEGRKDIPIVLFEATTGVDSGDIYLEGIIHLDGTELHDELRKKQSEKTFELCLGFLDKYPDVSKRRQTGEPTYYPKRSPADSELDIDKSIREQFDLLRIADPEHYPSFFEYRGQRYIIKIQKDG